MYRYDQYDQAMVDTRVEEFRDQVRDLVAVKLASRLQAMTGGEK